MRLRTCALARCLIVLPMLAAAAPRALAHPQPVLRIGVFADAQYADKPNSLPRRYSETRDKLRDCLDALAIDKPDRIVNLGDLIDGNGEKTRDDLHAMAALFTGLPMLHVVGNHCLAAGLPELMGELGLERPYHAWAARGFRFVVLFGMDVSTASPAGSPEAAEAREYLAADPKRPTYNGAIGKAQMAWLRGQLATAVRRREKVIVLCHMPALAASAGPWITLWNGEEVCRTLEQAGCVVAYIAGHEHRGGYAFHGGIHHLTMPGLVEAPEESTAYALLDLYRDRICVQGFGVVQDRELVFGKP